jgi:arylsulfatase A-like enzyme
MAALAALACLATAAPASARGQGPPRPPNIVLIVTDDQSAESMRRDVMPRTMRSIGDRGLTFSNAIVATSQCCPSRATMLTGDYPQNSGVVGNVPGYPTLVHKGQVLPAWLSRAGYNTIHVGKYLNGYLEAEGAAPAPGWRSWALLATGRYLDPNFSFDGTFRALVGQHTTEVINDRAVKAIDHFAPRRAPFYLQVDEFAPHVGEEPPDTDTDPEALERCRGGSIPTAEDAHAFESAAVPTPPNYDEEDISDKPEFLQRFPRLGEGLESLIQRRYGCALASLVGVDRGVGAIVDELRATGELRDTAIVFISDNGFSFGEHRIPLAKGEAYEEHLRVPLMFRAPRAWMPRSLRGDSSPAPVANVDLAPTILGLAGAEPCARPGACRTMDGRSLLPLLAGRDPAWTRDRAIRTSFGEGADSYPLSCQFVGAHTNRASIVENLMVPDADGHCHPADVFELYDLRADPFELENLMSTEPSGDPELEAEMRVHLERLRDCAGIAGRDERVGSRPHCE